MQASRSVPGARTVTEKNVGINCSNLALLAEYARRRNLGRMLTYGRLLNTLSPSDRRKIAHGWGVPGSTLEERNTENLFASLGTEIVASLDISDIDGADILADLMDDFAANAAMGPYLGTFDTVLDYGTSEHVFNFPQALVNAYNLLRPDGAYIFDLPVSGWVSHAVYQFSPSYFMALGASPWFELEWLFFHRKHGDRLFHIRHYNNVSYSRINGSKRISAWGVLKKVVPAGSSGPLTLNRLRAMQVDPRQYNRVKKPSLVSRLRSVRSYSARTVPAMFERND
ncbi:MAG TPA: class I SAM-dependent methyltransferase [Gammaproteobacteria bacterium]|nr:class I SAM-dependent methyltransferase [Gammaproteobacteria bacterium]